MDRLNGCSIPECQRPHDAKGYCKVHYMRWRNAGTTDLKPKPTSLEKFLNLLPEDRDQSGCWEWQGGRIHARGGYGFLRVGKKQEYAHRFSYEHYVGPIPEGYQVDHLCFNPPCVNPAHLEAVPQRVNMLRAQAKAKILLPEKRVIAMYRAGLSTVAIAKQLGGNTTPSGVNRLLKRNGIPMRGKGRAWN